MSTVGAIFINAESLFNNISIKKNNTKKEKDKSSDDDKEEKETNETELIEVNEDSESI